MLAAMVVVPTPPFGLNTATVRRARCIVTPSVVTIGARSRERWKRSSSASTRASSSRASNDRPMTSSAPASRKAIRSSTSSVALMHMTGHRGHRRRRPDLAADVDRGSWRRSTDAEDDELVLGGLREAPRPGRRSA